MIVANGEIGTDKLLMLGITAANVAALKEGKPMSLVTKTHPGIPEGLHVLIVYGETEQDIVDQLSAEGALTNTKIVKVPPTPEEIPVVDSAKRHARISGPVQNARTYKYSKPEIAWSCCPGVICGSARRVGVSAATDLARYSLHSFRHPKENGRIVVVDLNGYLRDSQSLRLVSPS